MQVTELESQGLKKNFKIIVGSDAIIAKAKTELEEVGKTAKIAGFRPGKVPFKVLQQMYGKAVEADVIKKLINSSINDLVEKNKFRPALTPKVDIEEYKDGESLSFSVAMEVFPELPELVFDSISLDRKTFEITEKDIDEAAVKIAERSPKFAELPKTTKAKNGNIVRIDFKGMVDGVAFEGGTAEDFELELGIKQFIGDFEEQLVGSKAGDKVEVKVSFPEQYQAANLAGKAAVFDVTVKAVLKAETPVVDEEFATARGFADLAALREAISKQMTSEYEGVVRNQLKKQLFDKLEEKFVFPLPESMVEAEFNTIWERVKQAKAEGDEELAGKSDEELTAEYKKVSNRRVTLGILLAEVGNKNNIQISREEVSQAVMQQARQYPGQIRQIIEFYQKNPDQLEHFRGPIMEEKAVDLILSKVKFNDSKIELKDLLNSAGEDAE